MSNLPEKIKWDWPLQKNDGVVRMVNDTRRFSVDLDIPTFKPNEIDVPLLLHFSEPIGKIFRDVAIRTNNYNYFQIRN